jgi:hypothetical protein
VRAWNCSAQGPCRRRPPPPAARLWAAIWRPSSFTNCSDALQFYRGVVPPISEDDTVHEVSRSERGQSSLRGADLVSR